MVSWDFANLWLPQGGGGAYDSLGVAFDPWGYRLSELSQFGGPEIVDNSRFFQFVRANPWPAFDPWHEMLLPGQEQTRPLLDLSPTLVRLTLIAIRLTGSLSDRRPARRIAAAADRPGARLLASAFAVSIRHIWRGTSQPHSNLANGSAVAAASEGRVAQAG